MIPRINTYQQNRIREQLEEQAKGNFQKMQTIANELLLDQRYLKIKELYEEARDTTVELMQRWYRKEYDPVKYKFKIDEYLIKLDLFKNFLQIPEDIVNNPVKQEKVNFVQQFLGKVKKAMVKDE